MNYLEDIEKLHSDTLKKYEIFTNDLHSLCDESFGDDEQIVQRYGNFVEICNSYIPVFKKHNDMFLDKSSKILTDFTEDTENKLSKIKSDYEWKSKDLEQFVNKKVTTNEQELDSKLSDIKTKEIDLQTQHQEELSTRENNFKQSSHIESQKCQNEISKIKYDFQLIKIKFYEKQEKEIQDSQEKIRGIHANNLDILKVDKEFKENNKKFSFSSFFSWPGYSKTQRGKKSIQTARELLSSRLEIKQFESEIKQFQSKSIEFVNKKEQEFNEQKEVLENEYKLKEEKSKENYNKSKQQKIEDYNKQLAELGEEKIQIDEEFKEVIKKIKDDHKKVSKENFKKYQSQIDQVNISLKNGIEYINSINEKNEKKYRTVKELVRSTYETYFHNIDSLESINDKSYYNIKTFDDDSYGLFDDLDNNENIKLIDHYRQYNTQKYIYMGNISLNSTIFDTNFELPALLPFIHSNTIILNYETQQGKKVLSDFIDSILLRTALTLPDGKVNFTFIDPIGMGESCSKLLGLNEEIYTKVYVDENDIDEQMNRLSNFVADINTKYLKHEYKNIKEYNQGIGDVEEPYRVMVAYEFPENYKAESLKKLKGVVQNGTRTGIQTILFKEKANNFDADYSAQEKNKTINDIAELSIVINENNGKYSISLGEDKYYAKDVTITNDALVQLDMSKNITSYINKKYEKIDDIKVSYIDQVSSLIENRSFWGKNASKDIEANIGKSGRSNQYFRINNKLEAHALLIGKSGSGKSNLLHMIITDLAFNYSPDDLHLYLIDMKGGIEFIRYVDYKLPHAKVASITSDREMAYSILLGLEQELQIREELFSSKGVQDISSYNENFKEESVARVLLILDEFQELFSKEDFIKRQSQEIFDRLAKKGRSFGINMILASQSLAGSTLPSSTLHQFAVRIVLQCSEDDSSKALSSSNTDAKLLTRPGEGIYNASNGQKDGNQRFQTYYMEEKEDDQLLELIQNYSDENNIKVEQKVFREDVRPSFDNFNHLIKSDNFGLSFPIGQPYSLNELTQIELRYESGANILISGNNEELAMNMLLTILSSLMLCGKKRFYIFNTYPANHPETYKLNNFVELLQDFDVELVVLNNKNILEVLESLEVKVKDFHDEIDKSIHDTYLLFFGLSRSRNFKKVDQYAPPTPEATLLDTIIKDGGECGIHTFIYLDSPKNLDQIFDNSTRNFFQIVLALQMSSDDSRKLIGVDIASNLGTQNGVLYLEDMNIIQKFRPLQLPNEQRLSHKLEILEIKEK